MDSNINEELENHTLINNGDIQQLKERLILSNPYDQIEYQSDSQNGLDS